MRVLNHVIVPAETFGREHNSIAADGLLIKFQPNNLLPSELMSGTEISRKLQMFCWLFTRSTG